MGFHRERVGGTSGDSLFPRQHGSPRSREHGNPDDFEVALWTSMAKDERRQAATSAKQVRWATEVKRRPQRAALAFLRRARANRVESERADHGYVFLLQQNNRK